MINFAAEDVIIELETENGPVRILLDAELQEDFGGQLTARADLEAERKKVTAAAATDTSTPFASAPLAISISATGKSTPQRSPACQCDVPGGSVCPRLELPTSRPTAAHNNMLSVVRVFCLSLLAGWPTGTHMLVWV